MSALPSFCCKPVAFRQILSVFVLMGTALMGTASLLPMPAIAQPSPIAIAPSPTAQMLVARNDDIAAAVHRLRQSKQRWIEVNLSSQRLTAWEGNTPLYAILISTGKAGTPTRAGVFAIQTRDRYARMKGADYDVADVPYTMYYSGNYAIHGAYWHHRFGTPVSHGCINVAVNHARWLYNWASIGTPVVIRR